MDITPLSADEVRALTRASLLLDSETATVVDAETIAANLRRAASFLCPTPPSDLVDAVRDAIAPLHAGDAPLRDLIAAELENLISTGDLLELRQLGQHAGRLIYLGPPTFVPCHAGRYLLLGVRPEGRALIDGDTGAGIQVRGHLRALALPPDTGPALLKEAGLHELRLDRWLKHPAVATSAVYLGEARTRLDAALPAGTVEGLDILDPTRTVRYYTGRWRQLGPTDSGDFLGRRPQAYGAASWCFVRVREGRPTALLDFPFADPGALPRDEAWRLQAAIDAERETPQLYRLSQDHGDRVLDLFSPIPSWVERSLAVVAERLERQRGALLSYRLPSEAASAAERLLTDMLWMQSVEQEEQA